MKYYDALAVLAEGAWNIWIRSLTSVTLLFHIINVLANNSPELKKVVGGATDTVVVRTKNAANAVAGNPTESDKARVALADSLAAERRKNAELKAEKQTNLGGTHTLRSGRGTGKTRGLKSGAVSRPRPQVTINMPQPTAAEQQLTPGEQEGQHWDKYINASSLRYFERSGLANFRKPVVEGIITSSASVVTYKNLVLRVQFTLNTGEVLKQEEVVAGFLSPGDSTPFKSKLKVPAHTKSITCVLIGAEYLLAPQ